MRLLFYISSMTGGGAERVMSILTSEMVSHGHEVTLATNCRYPFAYPIDPKIRILPLWPDNVRPRNGLLRIVRYCTNIRHIARQVHPDLIVSFLPNLCAVVWGLKIPVIQSIHTLLDQKVSYMGELNRKVSFVGIFSRRIVNKSATAVTVLTPQDLALVQKTLPQAIVMPNPLSFPIYTGNAPRSKTILAIGRLNALRHKGFDLLLEAWGKIAGGHPDWKLQIAGDGDPEHFAQVRSFIRQYRVNDSVELLGFRTDIDKLLQQASLFVLSSRWEGFGMVLIEAMSQGCPCVSFDCNYGPRNILESGKTGMLVPPEDPQALANMMAYMIDNQDVRERISSQALQEVQRYSPHVIAEQWETLFHQILNKLC